MESCIRQNDRERVIGHLIRSADPQTMQRVCQRMDSEGPFWYVGIRQPLLVWLTNALAAGGFAWEVHRVQENGIEMLEEAARRVRNGSEESASVRPRLSGPSIDCSCNRCLAGA